MLPYFYPEAWTGFMFFVIDLKCVLNVACVALMV